MDAAPQPRIAVDRDRIAAFCQKWHIVEFSLFGSVLRDDFRPDSDVDVLVVFDEQAGPPGLDWIDMVEELKEILGRNVDLLTLRSLKNPYRKNEILRSHQVIYRAA